MFKKNKEHGNKEIISLKIISFYACSFFFFMSCNKSVNKEEVLVKDKQEISISTKKEMRNKKISPQAVLALKEALSVITWKKDDLKDFLKLHSSD